MTFSDNKAINIWFSKKKFFWFLIILNFYLLLETFSAMIKIRAFIHFSPLSLNGVCFPLKLLVYPLLKKAIQKTNERKYWLREIFIFHRTCFVALEWKVKMKKKIYPSLKKLLIPTYFTCVMKLYLKVRKKRFTGFYKSALKVWVVNNKHVNVINVWLPAAI